MPPQQLSLPTKVESTFYSVAVFLTKHDLDKTRVSSSIVVHSSISSHTIQQTFLQATQSRCARQSTTTRRTRTGNGLSWNRLSPAATGATNHHPGHSRTEFQHHTTQATRFHRSPTTKKDDEKDATATLVDTTRTTRTIAVHDDETPSRLHSPSTFPSASPVGHPPCTRTAITTTSPNTSLDDALTSLSSWRETPPAGTTDPRLVVNLLQCPWAGKHSTTARHRAVERTTSTRAGTHTWSLANHEDRTAVTPLHPLKSTEVTVTAAAVVRVTRSRLSCLMGP